jgi:hypothetical protein
MPNFSFTDRGSLIFGIFALAITCWAVFDTRTFFRLLSFNRKTTLTHFEMMVIRVPGIVVILGLAWMFLVTVWGKR